MSVVCYLQESMELIYNKSKPVAVTCMAFPASDVNNYVVGSEEGTIYTASRHGRSVVSVTAHIIHLHTLFMLRRPNPSIVLSDLLLE